MHQIPPQPVGIRMPASWQTVFMVTMVLPTVLLFAWAVRVWWRDRDPIPFWCLLGGALSIFMEPIITTLGALHYPQVDQWTLFASLNQKIPIFVLPAYTWVIGGVGLVGYQILNRGGGRRQLWQLYGAGILLNIAIEVTMQRVDGLVVYYGTQSITLFGFPLYWGFTTFAVGPVIGVVLWRLRPHLTGWMAPLVTFIVPMLCGAVYGATTWPVFNAMNTGLPNWAVDLAGVGTWALGGLAIWTAGRLITPAAQAATSPATRTVFEPQSATVSR